MRTATADLTGGDDDDATMADGGTVQADRLAVEPWLPHQYRWANVTTPWQARIDSGDSSRIVVWTGRSCSSSRSTDGGNTVATE
jgi:hypothetical protein